jgi:cobalt-zinc-cadmium efflux system outer membrane protein
VDIVTRPVLLSCLAGAVLAAQTPASAPVQSTLSIGQAVEEAVRNNLDLIAERQNVPVGRAREITAALRPNPVFTFGMDYLDWLRRGLTVQNSAGPSEWNTHVDYTVEWPGKRQSRIDLARVATSVAELRLLDAIRQLALSVRLASVDYLLAKENLDLAKANLEVFTRVLNVNQAKVNAGDLAGVELIRTRVARQQVENSVQQAELRLNAARANLRHLLGRKPAEPAPELAVPLSEQPVVVLLEEARAQALEQRPDLLAARRDIERSKADARLQQVNARPDLTASLFYHHQYGYSDGRTFGTYFAFPLPVYNRNQGEILRAQRETEQGGQRVQALENTIATEVGTAWQQYDAALKLLEKVRSSLLPEARQVRDITEFSYSRGEASLLEFLDAQRAYNDAMQSYNDARADYTRSLYLIDAVTGKAVSQ